MIGQLAYVALGGAIGASLRHLCNVAALKWLAPAFPFSTLFVNIVGSFAMGLLAGWLSRKGFAPALEWRLFFATGFLGGFTTFSAFSLDAVLLWERGESNSALIYVVCSVVLSLLALMVGLMLVRNATGNIG